MCVSLSHVKRRALHNDNGVDSSSSNENDARYTRPHTMILDRQPDNCVIVQRNTGQCPFQSQHSHPLCLSLGHFHRTAACCFVVFCRDPSSRQAEGHCTSRNTTASFEQTTQKGVIPGFPNRAGLLRFANHRRRGAIDQNTDFTSCVLNQNYCYRTTDFPYGYCRDFRKIDIFDIFLSFHITTRKIHLKLFILYYYVTICFLLFPL